MLQVDVNYLAIIVAAIINLVLGFLWYGPLFGRRWMTLTNGYHLLTLLIGGALLAVWA